MDLSTGSLGWHRTRRWLDSEINREYPESYNLTPEQREYLEGLRAGMQLAYMNVRRRFNTPEEDAEVEKVRRDMFG